MRMTAEDALKHPWLSSEMTSKRKAISLLQTALDTMEETDARLLSEVIFFVLHYVVWHFIFL